MGVIGSNYRTYFQDSMLDTGGAPKNVRHRQGRHHDLQLKQNERSVPKRQIYLWQLSFPNELLRTEILGMKFLQHRNQ